MGSWSHNFPAGNPDVSGVVVPVPHQDDPANLTPAPVAQVAPVVVTAPVVEEAPAVEEVEEPKVATEAPAEEVKAEEVAEDTTSKKSGK